MYTGISCSGSTHETVRYLIAREQGHYSVCNELWVSITKHSDLVLYATPSEIKYFQPLAANHATGIGDALFVSIMASQTNNDISTRRNCRFRLKKP
jgi:DNA-binding MurR/RpiR family transcriptional regulator